MKLLNFLVTHCYYNIDHFNRLKKEEVLHLSVSFCVYFTRLLRYLLTDLDDDELEGGTSVGVYSIYI